MHAGINSEKEPENEVGVNSTHDGSDRKWKQPQAQAIAMAKALLEWLVQHRVAVRFEEI